MDNTVSYIIRSATPDDAEAIGRINVDVWKSTYTGLIAQEVLDQMKYEQYILKWKNILGRQDAIHHPVSVAEVDRKVAGYVSTGLNSKEDSEFAGELYALYLRPEYHGMNIGKSLFKAAMNDFLEMDIHSFNLYVLKENMIGRRFYDRFEPDETRVTEIQIENGVYCDMLYGWHSVEKILEKYYDQ